ncbi:MAG TPA: MarR family winged helix-turn-helix transcriptional regulator [Acidimicrobiia bacterium]|jgi:DNA-binding MarR family transcriptional regulator
MARPRRLDEDQRVLWKTYRDVFNGLATALQAQLLRDADLSGSEYALLAELSHAPDGVQRARELGHELAWDRSRLSHLVTRMEKRGLVVREECAEDARGSMVRLTAAGRGAVDDAAPEHSAAIRRYFFDQLSEAEVAQLDDIFRRILDHLPSAGAPTAG